MIISDNIAKIIEEMLDESDGILEFRRNDFATKFGCVPSQINYVIMSRFTPERGYITESRRGGGGYIKIVRKKMYKNEYLMHFFYAIGDEIDENESSAYLTSLFGNDIISEREYKIISASLSNSALSELPNEVKNSVRANIMRHIILSLME